MALDEIAANMKLQKRLCHNAPFYVLGPLVTDIGVATTTSPPRSVALSLPALEPTSCAT
mgnify:CR=1 FL=1